MIVLYLLVIISIVITVIVLYKQLQLYKIIDNLYDKNNDLENKLKSSMETQNRLLNSENQKLQELILESGDTIISRVNESIKVVAEESNINLLELTNNINGRDENTKKLFENKFDKIQEEKSEMIKEITNNIKNYINIQKDYLSSENIETKKYISKNIEKVILNIEHSNKSIINENNITSKRLFAEASNKIKEIEQLFNVSSNSLQEKEIEIVESINKVSTRIENLINEEINTLISGCEKEKKQTDKILFEISDNRKNMNLLNSKFNVIEEIFRLQLVNYLIDDANDAIKLLKEKDR